MCTHHSLRCGARLVRHVCDLVTNVGRPSTPARSSDVPQQLPSLSSTINHLPTVRGTRRLIALSLSLSLTLSHTHTLLNPGNHSAALTSSKSPPRLTLVGVTPRIIQLNPEGAESTLLFPRVSSVYAATVVWIAAERS